MRLPVQSSRPRAVLLAALALVLGAWAVLAPATPAPAAPAPAPKPAPPTPPKTVFAAPSSQFADAASAFNAFRAAIPGPNNGANPPPQATGRREINWDGVRLDGTDPFTETKVLIPNKLVAIPVNRFQERGVIFEDPYAVSGPDGFSTANPGLAGQFPAFSPDKTFAMFDDNGIEFDFVLPSAHTTTPVPAKTNGFGAIFLDVETDNTTSMELFSGPTSLGKYYVPKGASAQPEFLGVLFNDPIVTRVELVVGNAVLFTVTNGTIVPGPADNPPSVDQAATDDFVYPEPQPLSFADVGKEYWPFAFIERLFISGITTGCTAQGVTPRNYCPQQVVTRDQMTAFLLRAKHGANYQPPPATGTIFADVPATQFFAAFIEQAYKEGITTGCTAQGVTPIRYCPNDPVTRDQMAAYIERTLHPGVTPPPGTGLYFADVPATYFFANWIEALFRDNVTTGCIPSTLPTQRYYCPHDSVLRDQMATFLVRAFLPSS